MYCREALSIAVRLIVSTNTHTRALSERQIPLSTKDNNDDKKSKSMSLIARKGKKYYKTNRAISSIERS